MIFLIFLFILGLYFLWPDRKEVKMDITSRAISLNDFGIGILKEILKDGQGDGNWRLIILEKINKLQEDNKRLISKQTQNV